MRAVVLRVAALLAELAEALLAELPVDFAVVLRLVCFVRDVVLLVLLLPEVVAAEAVFVVVLF